jgi:hypothetical protein
VLIVRPQEVVAAVQALGLANADLAAAVGEYNRAQFRLYRALGHPAEALGGAVEGKPTAPVSAPVPAMVPTQLPPVKQTSYADRPSTVRLAAGLPSPKPLDQDEPRRLPRGVIASADPVRPRTTVRDLAVTRAMLAGPPAAALPEPPAELFRSVAKPIAEVAPPKPPPQPEVVWTSAASPVPPATTPAIEPPKKAADAPLPDIPAMPTQPAKSDPPAVEWGKAK